jgi:hypothetical protein
MAISRATSGGPSTSKAEVWRMMDRSSVFHISTGSRAAWTFTGSRSAVAAIADQYAARRTLRFRRLDTPARAVM